MNDLQKTKGHITLLDVAKALPSVPHTMMTNNIGEVGAPETITRMVVESYAGVPTLVNLHNRN